MLAYVYPRSAGAPAAESMSFGTFDEFEAWAVQNAILYDPAQLAAARERYREGHVPHPLFDGNELMQISWTRMASQVQPSETGPQCAIKLAVPVVIIYDCWTPPRCRGRGLYPLVLRALVRDAHVHGHDAWIYCYADNYASVRGIEKAGFRLHSRLEHTRVFGLEYGRIIDLAKAS